MLFRPRPNNGSDAIRAQLSPDPRNRVRNAIRDMRMANRVLFLTLTDGLYGGEKCLLGMLAGLSSTSPIDPIVVVTAEGRLTAELEKRGIPWVVHSLLESRSYWNVPSLSLQARRWLNDLKPRMIYINANTYWRPFEIPVARLMGIPVVTHHHLLPDTLSPFHRYSNLAVANSHYVASSLPIHGLDVQVLDNPVELDAFDRATPNPAFYGISPGELSVFFIGQIKAIKGVDMLLDAAAVVSKEIPEVRFVLIGDTNEDSYLKHVRSRIEAMPQVRWMGFDPSIEQAYATADVIVMPSSWDEPFGRIAIEAGAAAKPIVCTQVGGIPEIVHDGKTGLLVRRNDGAQLASALLHLLKNPELRIRLGKAARREVERRFAAPVVSRRLEELIVPLLNVAPLQTIGAPGS